MSVLLLTVFLSICLAGLFMVFFWMDFNRRNGGSLEQDALLPFADEEDPPKPDYRNKGKPGTGFSPRN